MTAALRVLHVMALGLWVGAVVFFSFVTAPSLFAALPRDMAGRATAAIFPRYYLLGWTCGVVAGGALLGQILRRGSLDGRLLAGVLLLSAMLGSSFYAGRVILPRAAAARAAMAGLARPAPELATWQARFDRLHHQSVALNGVVLLSGILALAIAALPPRTS